ANHSSLIGVAETGVTIDFYALGIGRCPANLQSSSLFRRDRRNEHDSLRNAAPFSQSDHSLRDGNRDRLVAAQRRYRCGEGQNVSAPA
ncbi:hypothetical protein, partial [Stutzerimonas nitrititolerans]|uniref:hypothetical protein n=1 Tax=Stutzerimonas nitrititolerans TaxID=2482751 RepID=UPI00289F0724